MTARIATILPAQYHADDLEDGPTLSASIANVLLNQSPAHARAQHPRLNPAYVARTEEKFDVGTVVHALLLEGISVMEVLAFPDWRSKAAKEARELSRAHGRIPLLDHQAVEVEAMVAAVAEQLADLDVDPIPLTAGKPEQTIVWEEAGVQCRARLDWLHDDLSAIDDIKTSTRVGHPRGWMDKTLYDHGCDLQAAAYLRGVRALTGQTPQWRWLLMETSAPYALSVITPEPDVLAIGDAKFDKALALWKECLATDRWPAYGNTLHHAELPSWIESRWLEREARDEVMAA